MMSHAHENEVQLAPASETVILDYHGRAKRIIERFVRTAVLIDDDWPALFDVINYDASTNALVPDPGRHEPQSEPEIEADLPEYEDDTDVSSGVLPSVTRGAPGIMSSDSGLNANGARLLSIQNDFIRRGVIFTGFRYTKKDEDRGPRLAKNADILILDWNFAGDNGAGAMKILQELRKDGQLRFVCIFTDQPELFAIKDSIVKTVFESSESADSRFDFAVENFIFTLRNKAVGGLQSDEVSQVETLFDDAIGNIATHYSGFVQLSVLEMSSHHRRTMMTHLTRFSRDFDSAILSEAAQEDSPVDMGACLRSLLIDEWRVALEASSLSNDRWMLSGGRGLYASSLKKNLPQMTAEFIVACANEVGVSGAAATLPGLFDSADFGGIKQRKFDHHVGSWLDGGVVENLQLPGIAGKKNTPKLTFAVLYALNHPLRAKEKPTAEEIYKNVMRLEALFNQQLTLPPAIMQGTILKYDKDTYFICISPLCDTARYGEGHHPYTFLEALSVDSSKFLDRAPDYCVFVEGERPVCLHLDIKRPHVFEIDHINRKTPHLGKDVLARYRKLPPKQTENLVPAGTSSPKDVGGVPPLQETSSAYEVSGKNSDGQIVSKVAVTPMHESIHLNVVGQLRNDFFLMFSAASASNAARVGVNRVEYIRAAKAG